MPKRHDEPMSRVHMWMYDRDLDRIAANWPQLTRSEVVQMMVRQYLDRIDARAAAASRRLNADTIIGVLDGE